MNQKLKKTSSSDYLESAFNAFEAVKRALLHRGVVRQKNKKSQQKTQKTKTDKLVEVSEKSHDILYSADTVFPFTLFPDTITLDREKVTIARRYFIQVAKITSTPIRDILSVESNIGPFFGSIRMSSRYFITNPFSVNFLWRKDAEKLQRLLQGYIIVHEQEIDCTNIDTPKLIKLLNKLGRGDTG